MPMNCSMVRTTGLQDTAGFQEEEDDWTGDET